jgi:hypothetical protein
MGLHGAIFTSRLHSLNEIRVYGPNPGLYGCRKYKIKFDKHVSYLLVLRELNQIDFFVSGLDKSIKFVVQSHEPTIEIMAYCKAITLEGQR